MFQGSAEEPRPQPRAAQEVAYRTLLDVLGELVIFDRDESRKDSLIEVFTRLDKASKLLHEDKDATAALIETLGALQEVLRMLREDGVAIPREIVDAITLVRVALAVH